MEKKKEIKSFTEAVKAAQATTLVYNISVALVGALRIAGFIAVKVKDDGKDAWILSDHVVLHHQDDGGVIITPVMRQLAEAVKFANQREDDDEPGEGGSIMWLWGSAGAGKSFCAKQIAALAGVEFFEFSCNASLQPKNLFFKSDVEEGSGVVIPTPLLEGLQHNVMLVDGKPVMTGPGALILIDEFAVLPIETSIGLNGVFQTIMSGGGLLPTNLTGGRKYFCHNRITVVLTSNTSCGMSGAGMGESIYNGQQLQMDPSTRARIMPVIEFKQDFNLIRNKLLGLKKPVPPIPFSILWDLIKVAEEDAARGDDAVGVQMSPRDIDNVRICIKRRLPLKMFFETFFNRQPTTEAQNMVMHVLKQWGIDKF